MERHLNLKEIRQLYGLSQDEVAKAIGVRSRGTVIAVENGERSLTSEEIGRLADKLGLDITDLLQLEIPNYNKYTEMLAETLRQYERKTGHAASKTLFAKLIYLEDFAWYYDHLKPMSGMKYRRLQYGPVPDQFFRIVDDMVNEGDIILEIEPVKPGHSSPAQKLALSSRLKNVPTQYLSIAEKELIEKIVEKWKDANVDKIVDFTHQQLPWQICRPDEFIPYELITQEEPDNVF